MSEKKLAKVFYTDLWGLRKEKYEYLFGNDVQRTKWQELKPVAPYYFLIPKDFALQSEYEKFWKVTEIFGKWSSGVETGKDEKLVGFSPQEIIKVFLDLFNPRVSMKDLETFHDLKPTSGWKIEDRREGLFSRGETFFQGNIIPYTYRPFDIRFTYYCDLLRRAHRETLEHLLKDNFALVTSRLLSIPPFRHAFVTQNVGDRCYVSIKTKETGYFFPLYLYLEHPEGGIFGKEGKPERISNFTPEFLQAVKESLGFEPTPEEIFYYIYAVLYSPTYRKRYEEFLKIDFPRIPLPSNDNVFKELSNLGKELVELHLLKASALDETEIGFPKDGSNKVEKVFYDEKNERAFINKEQYFDSISKQVWEYRIGAYQVMEKYLKDRKGRKLSLDEINHYMKVAKAIQMTIELQEKIEMVYRDNP